MEIRAFLDNGFIESATIAAAASVVSKPNQTIVGPDVRAVTVGAFICLR